MTYNSFVFRNVTAALRYLCHELMENGEFVSSRNGATREMRHVNITLTEPLERYIDLPGRGHSPTAQIAETMWVLAGRNDVDWLSHYLPRARDFSDDGHRWRGAYGTRIRSWGVHQEDVGIATTVGPVDQLAHVVDLLKADPDTRRALITLYDPVVDSAPGKDIPCNNWLHFLARDGRLDLHVAVRSNDLMWGWSGINAFEWSVLLEVVAGLTGLKVGQLHFSIGSLHLYEQHWDRARQLAEAPLPSSFVHGSPLHFTSVAEMDQMIANWFAKEKWVRTNTGDAGIDETSFWASPALREWMKTIARKWARPDPFADDLVKLHDQKHAAYGNSWMKRGELFSIIPNIARKVDRLGTGADTDDETQADTAADLFVYLAKYRLWLTSEDGAPAPYDIVDDRQQKILTSTDAANLVLRRTTPTEGAADTGALVGSVESRFERLLIQVEDRNPDRYKVVDAMLADASGLARSYRSKSRVA